MSAEGGSGGEQMFREAAQNVIYSFYDGANVAHFAYGPTAGGKTYTMQGPLRCRGAVPRTLDRLFRPLLSQVCKGAPVRPICFKDLVLLSALQASSLTQKRKSMDKKGPGSAADFSTFHLPASDSGCICGDEAQLILTPPVFYFRFKPLEVLPTFVRLPCLVDDRLLGAFLVLTRLPPCLEEAPL
ncbi:hypothetical protein HPB52_018905 [Rhipicephalus sanguineus]|uniref:Kinesin motor domain-containing protein n=1 Tax=Rhipicephalus sanguineus TaxID=34632 RepID=A0A9D4TBD4_RHISA|nr:hypothetical protein HPB52_018905 [Rhipicephalus sanguineus]